jgi:CheY-like chemotaxis protein
VAGSSFSSWGDQGGEDGGGDDAENSGSDGSASNTSRLIIVVDDDPFIVEGLALLLEGWGYTVLTALSIEELSRRLPEVKGPPGLILADHFLPQGGSGAQAVELVRRHTGAPVPAIILTGDTAPERQAEAAALGCGLLHKPVQVAPLRAAVDALMRE